MASHATADERYAALRARLADRKEEDAATAHAKRQAARQAKKAKARAAEGASGAVTEVYMAGGDASSSDDDGAEGHAVAAARQQAARSGAYHGMREAGSTDSDDEGRERPQAQLLRARAAPADVPSQEALALKLLAARGL